MRLDGDDDGWRLGVWADVDIRFRPITRKAWRDAKRAAAAVMKGAAVEDVTDAEITDELMEEAGDEISRILLERGIAEWRGIADAVDVPLPVTPETVALLLADPRRFERLDQLYVMPFVLRDMVGNGSAGSPSGIGTGATPASDTAISAAPPVPASDAPSARTRRTRSKTRKPNASGKS